ncbi:MAG: hypothetical protein JNJ43_18680, partial [Anaerolineales bacterium]|nr:hypothetical protein [Anaerolineales bacterium]
SLFGMNGEHTLITLVEVGVLASLLGIGLLYYLFRPLSDFSKKVFQINVLFLILVLAGVFTTLPRLWGLTLVFNSSAVLAITVASVDVLFSRKK